MFSFKSLIAALSFSLVILFSPVASAQEWSLEKPQHLGWYEVIHKCINFEKQDKKNYAIFMYYGTNKNGEHKYSTFSSQLIDIQSTDMDAKFVGKSEYIYSNDYKYVTGGSGYKEGNEQPFIPDPDVLGSSLLKSNLQIQGGAGILQGDYSAKIVQTDKRTVKVSVSYPHNEGGHWLIERTFKRPSETSSVWLLMYEHFLATHTKRDGCIAEYTKRRMDASKEALPKLVR